MESIKKNPYIPIIVIAVMLVGFLTNRVVFSIGILLASLLSINFKFWKAPFNRNPIIYSVIGIIAVYLLSDLLKSNIGTISGRTWMKFILLLMPLYIWSWNPNLKNIRRVNDLLLVFGTIITCYSLSQYFINYSGINLLYERAKVMPVLAFSDHIRVSWFIAVTCLIAFYQFMHSIGLKKYKYLIYLGFQIIFLHMLGAKTGLVTLYLSGLILGIGYIIKSKKSILILPLLFAIISGPIIAYKSLPSFQKRVQFVKYDFDHYINGNYRGGLSDAIRFYSIKGGFDLLKEKPLTGHGFINTKAKMADWYSSEHPAIEPSSYTLPSNQFLIFGVGIGAFGIGLFLFHILAPLFLKEIQTNVLFLSFYIPSSISFLYETHLEAQMAIFVYAFFLAWMIQISRNRKKEI